ncbi:MAG: cytochrome c [Polyangiaceae bacterium]
MGATAYTVVGAPSGFNIRKFYDDLMPWLDEQVKPDPKRLRKIAWCMVLGSDGDVKSAASKPDPELEAVRSELRDPLDGGVTTDKDAEIYAHLAATQASPRAEDATASASPHFEALSKPKRQGVLRKLWEKHKANVALLGKQLNALKVTLAVGKIQTTNPGPGRVDAFMTAVNIMTEAKEDVPMSSPVAFPALWGLSELHWFHWDDNTNATFQRNVGQAIGTGAQFATNAKQPEEVIASTLKIKNVEALEEIVKTIQSPKSPFPIDDQAQFNKGEGLYRQKCGICHDAPSDGKPPEEHPQAALWALLKTDDTRLKNFEQNVKDEPLIDYLSHLLTAVEKYAKPQKPQADPKWRTTKRYGFRKLQGVWATAPYLHNDSVPTLADLLAEPTKRPATFAIDRSSYDTERVGFKTFERPSDGPFPFDTAQPGNGNQGHAYGTELKEDEKRALLAYLLRL